MRMKKTLSILLVICMLMGLFPMFSANVKAAESTDKTGDLYLDKTAVLEEDGSYTIKLEAYATGTPVTTQVKTGKPLQIVIAVDQSGSMVENLSSVRNAITEFMEIIAANGRSFNVEHKVAIVGFASNEEDGVSSTTGSSIAGGSDNQWVNTGVFDSNGEFQNYSSGTAVYTTYTGTLGHDDTYYIKLSDGTYAELTYLDSRYSIVSNPATDRTDLYVNVNGKYIPVTYQKDVYVKTQATDTTKDYYVDVNGEKTEIYAVQNEKEEMSAASSIVNKSGKVYYIDVNGTKIKLEYVDYTIDNSTLGLVYNWSGSDGNTYTNYKGFFGMGEQEMFFRLKGDSSTEYEPYIITQEIDYDWFIVGDDTTSLDLTNYTVYEKTEGWIYVDNEGNNIVTTDTLYEIKDSKVWVYENASGETVVLNDETVYTREGGELETIDYQDALVPVTDGEDGQGEITESITTSISNLSASGATRTSYGLEMAERIFESNYHEEEHGHVVIMFTDGKPGFSNSSGYTSEANASLAIANDLKTIYDASIYTVGLYDSNTDSDVSNFMNGVSSNYKDVSSLEDITSANKVSDKYYQNTSNIEELNSIFTNITVDSTTTSTTVALDDTAIMRDILGTGMELMPGTTITAIKVPGTKASDSANIVWNTNKAESLGSLTIDKDKPISEFTNDANSNIKLYNLNGNVMGDSGESHPHTVDVSGFDYCGDYIAVGKDGYKLVVTITGVEASAYAIWNQAMYTNNDYSGIWTPQTETADRELQASFVQPTTMLTSTNYVVDYAKPFEVDLANDLGMNTVYHLDADDTNRFDPANPVHNVQGTYGKATIENNTLTYTPMTMSWEYEADNPNKRGYETIYAFGNTTDERVLANTANAAEGHLWSRFNVIPANNIYYEDDFVTTSTDGTTQTGTIGIEYSPNWVTVGTSSGNTGNENSGTHGWIESLSKENQYSDGSAHVSSTPGARATFTFTGTGVDIYSRTDKTTGLVIGMLYKGHGIKDENGKNKVAEKMIWMDTLSESSGEGAYYQIPTLSFCDLEYGTYTVMLTVAKDLIKDDYERMTYYLDGIRVYNPLKNRENVDSTITDAYGKSEINAIFKEVRDCLLTEGSYGADEVSGAVFIDKFGDKVGYEESELIADFETFGPKNEVYLANGQLIAFVVSYDAGAQYYVGMKSISGTAIKSTYQYQGASNEVAINHTADLYYEVTPEWKDTNNDGVYDKGIVSIANTGGTGVLAISKLKITNPMPEAVETTMFSSMSRAQLISYANTLDMNVAVEEDGKVEIENSEEEKEEVENVNPGEVPVENLDGISEKLFADMYGWF